MDELYLLSVKAKERRQSEPRRIADALEGLEGASIVGRADLSVVKIRIASEDVEEVRRRTSDFCHLQKYTEMELL